jgi:hypothetical protein
LSGLSHSCSQCQCSECVADHLLLLVAL